jgi:hypothetical protein
VVERTNVQSSDLVEGHEENVTDVHLYAFSSTLVSMLCGLVLCYISFNASGFHRGGVVQVSALLRRYTA